MDTRHPSIARREDSVLALVDCQDRLWKVIHDRDALERSCRILLQGARLLDIPILVTEQYAKGLGPTIPGIRELLGEARVIGKSAFSSAGEPAFIEALEALERGTLVVAGIEAHICVAQTALDGLAWGYKVHVVSDAVGTRDPANREVGLGRMRDQGAVVTSVESVLFDWMGSCEDPVFKQVQELIK